MTRHKRLIVLSAWGSDKVFGDLYDSVYHHGKRGNNLFQLDLGPDDTIVLEGGTDINPNFYDQVPCKFTQRPDMSRDAMESMAIRKGMESNANFIGICRGAQFLTARAGGELIQHVNGHTNGNHMITVLFPDGASERDKPGSFQTNSFHHQMMFPFGLPKEDYKILAKAEQQRSTEYLIEGNVDVQENFDMLPVPFVETEIMWLSKIKGLCIQGHPEFVVSGNPRALKPNNPLRTFVEYSRDLVEEYILI